MAHLEIREGVNAGQRFSLPDAVSLGRSEDNLICLPDNRVSRRHARIVRQGSRFVVEDLNSANGTFLRGQRIPPGTSHHLDDGDEIWLCSMRLVFHAGESEPELGPMALKMFVDDTARSEVQLVLDAAALTTQTGECVQQTEEELQAAIERLQAMCRVSTALGVMTDQDELMQKILDCIFDVFPTVDRAFIVMQQEGESEFQPVAVKSRAGDLGPQAEVAISRTILDEVVTHKHSILSYDAMSDQRFECLGIEV